MDQERLAGVGNLLADEILWRAGLAPGRRTPLTDDELRVLHKELRATLRQLGRRGGSHMGELMEERVVGGALPAGRRGAAPRDRGRPDHLLVPGAPALTATSVFAQLTTRALGRSGSLAGGAFRLRGSTRQRREPLGDEVDAEDEEQHGHHRRVVRR